MYMFSLTEWAKWILRRRLPKAFWPIELVRTQILVNFGPPSSNVRNCTFFHPPPLRTYAFELPSPSECNSYRE